MEILSNTKIKLAKYKILILYAYFNICKFYIANSAVIGL